MHGYCAGTSAEEMWGRKRGAGGGRNKIEWRKLHEFRIFLMGDDMGRVAYRGGDIGEFKPPEIPKALQNHAKLNPIVKTVKNC